MIEAKTLRRIEADLIEAIGSEPVDADAVKLAATRIGAQAEMIEEGLAS